MLGGLISGQGTLTEVEGSLWLTLDSLVKISSFVKNTLAVFDVVDLNFLGSQLYRGFSLL